MKFVKILLIVTGLLVTLFVAAAVILVATVDPNEYKGEIAQAVKDSTGRELKFEGDIGFNFFPWLGLNVGPVALGNAPGFTPAEMVRINKAEASIQIMPLLSGQVAIGTVVLDGFTANLSVNEKGVTNWDDLAKGDGEKKTEETAATDDGSQSGGASKLESLSVLGVEITNANVTYDDKKTGKLASLTDLNLIIGEVGDKLPTPFSLTFDLKLNDPKIETRPTLKGIATMDLEAKTFAITEMVFDILGMNLSGKAFAKAAEGVSYSSEFKLATFDPRLLMKELGIEPPKTTAPDVLGALSADMKVNGTDNAVQLEQLTVLLDDTTITGTGSVVNFAKPAVQLAVNVNDIDVDRYMPPASDKPAEKQTTTEKKDAAPAQEPDLSALKGQNVRAKLTIGKLKAMNLRIMDILCDMKIKNGIVTVAPFSANMYEGNLTAQSKLDANTTPARWEESAVLKGVQAGPLLKDFMDNDLILGTTKAKYQLTGLGLTPDNIKKSITGTASFAFLDGAINGVNIAQMIRNAFNTLKGKSSAGNEPAKTDFAELSGSAVLRKGHVANNDLLMKSPLLRLSGNGWVNLPRNELDYKSRVKIVGTLKGQDGSSMDELTGLTIPVYASGSLDNPSIGLDTKALADALLKDATKDIGKTLQKSLGGEGEEKEGVGGLLKSLF